jgi:DNA-binding LacI/PurR family transcriptional regulator
MRVQSQEILAMPAPSLRESVTMYFREAIRTGKLQPGESLPSSRELAELLNTSYPNVHYGLTPLVKEGLLTRSRKDGTVVNEHRRELTCVAIYAYHCNLDDMPQFQHTLIDLICANLQEKGIDARLIMDNASRYGLEQVRQWAELGQIQGIIMPSASDRESFKAFQKLPLAFSYLTTSGAQSPIQMDQQGLIRLAIAGVSRQGGRKLGLISSIERFDADDRENPFYLDLQREARTAGIEIRPQWLQTISKRDEYIRTHEMATEFGFNCCERLLQLPKDERPDTLFIFSDRLVTGAMLALMKHRLDIPGELKLVIHRNWEISIPLFTPCVMVGLSIAEVASALTANLIAQYNGEKVKKSLVSYQNREFKPETKPGETP